MKSSSFIINTARGGIINEDALFTALSQKSIAGAALDCFNDETVIKPNRFGELDNVILAPHSIAWTQELFRDIGMMCNQHMIDLANGIRPHGVVNPEVFDRPSFQEKWKALSVQPNPISS
jgi:phosphoglycerate dehydrogenase-like enzyme